MSFIRIDEEACKRDGACVAECPIGLIRRDGPKDFPRPAAKAAELCIRCGHCAAVCPGHALSLEPLPDQAFEPLRKELEISPEQAEQFFKGRRSVRAYKSKPVDPKLITRILDATSWAPTGHNAQPVKWVAVPEREKVEELLDLVAEWMAGFCRAMPEKAALFHLPGVVAAWRQKRKDLICRGAPSLVVAYGPRQAVTPDIDAHIATAHAELLAHAHGLGACWAGYFLMAAANHEPLRQALGMGEDETAYGALMLGWPRYRYARIPPREAAEVTWL